METIKDRIHRCQVTTQVNTALEVDQESLQQVGVAPSCRTVGTAGSIGRARSTHDRPDRS
ncbi:hypothetical protein DCC25_06500 [Auritidibacter sp. NML120636]|nr:hypothetical protein DCC25_06500 [Auritidibacter sp. NML120636]PXA82444.1 hypothetical protein DCC26_00645 [Auritidibacter sp. NML120779]